MAKIKFVSKTVKDVTDRYYGATHDRGYGATSKWPKAGLSKRPN